jgi:hypothetical protein
MKSQNRKSLIKKRTGLCVFLLKLGLKKSGQAYVCTNIPFTEACTNEKFLWYSAPLSNPLCYLY